MSLSTEKSVYFIAGEASGDQLGAWLIQQLQAEYPRLECLGVGGASMRAAGQKQLMDAHELSYFGISEVLYNFRKIYLQRQKILADIHTCKPKALITIDLPDFNFSIGRWAKRMGIPVIHVGAPTVWAWRPKRAQKVARFLNHLLCLFPFEPQYFIRHGLSSFFIGHPLVQGAQWVRPKASHQTSPRLLLLPGSRKSEVQRLLPLMLQAAAQLKPYFSQLHVDLVQMDATWELAQKIVQAHKHVCDVQFIESSQKNEAMQKATVALAASGTVTLDLAVNTTPMVIVYKLGMLSSLVARTLIRTSMVGLPNIILNKKFIPELLQEQCTPNRMVHEVKHLLEDAQARENQILQLHRVVERLKIQPDVLNKTWHKIFDKIL